MKWLRRLLHPDVHGPSDEAIRARDEATELNKRADTVYGERRKLLSENHFAERIRLIYEGRL